MLFKARYDTDIIHEPTTSIDGKQSATGKAMMDLNGSEQTEVFQSVIDLVRLVDDSYKQLVATSSFMI
jgi:hypothetical protein